MRSVRMFGPLLIGMISTGCRDAPKDAPPPAPVAIQVPAGQKLLLTAKAKGVQVYRCEPPHDGGAYTWKNERPEAELLDPQGKVIGKHYAGPTWESTDGSKVVGEVSATHDSPIPGAVPWLLLLAHANIGAGVFFAVKSIQRVDTRGGAAPKDGCDASHVGTETKVDYTATYRFFGSD